MESKSYENGVPAATLGGLERFVIFGFVLFSPWLCSAAMSTKPALDFVAAINSHSLTNIGALMTDGHTFIDSQNNKIKGKDKMLAGWRGYLEWFPDYKIEIEKTLMDGDTVALFGKASGTFGDATGARTNAHWELPAAWRAQVKGEKIDVWQVYADTKIPFEIINRYTQPTNNNNIQGFGGVFFKSEKPKELAAWYDEHLGTQFGKQGYSLFRWREHENAQRPGTTTFGIFKSTSAYFAPSTNTFMFNFRVRDLDSMLKKLKKEGVTVMEKVQSFDYGKFGWILDPDGNKIELWQPMNEEEQFGKK